MSGRLVLVYRRENAHSSDIAHSPSHLPIWLLITCLRQSLQLLHSSNISRLDVVLILLNLGLEIIDRDLFVLNDDVDLQLLDTVADGDELVTTPGKTVHLDGLDTGYQLVHVGLVVPRLDVQGDDGFGGGLLFLFVVVYGQ